MAIDREYKEVIATHPDGSTTSSFHYVIGRYISRAYKAMSAAKGGRTRHMKRGGVSKEWFKRHPEVVK